MKWSQLKKRIEDGFAEVLQGRVQLYTTSYNHPKSSSGRGWITLDGKEIVSFNTLLSGRIYGCIYHESTPTGNMKHPAVAESGRTPGALTEDGEFSRFDLHNCCFAFLNLSIDAALEHESPIINMLAVLDKRSGKRRLAAMDPVALHPLVRKFLEIRMALEGMKPVS